MKNKKTHLTAIILTLCFLTPTLVMLAAFSEYGMAPFGEKSVLIMDMSGQYSEFFLGLKNLGKNSSIFFSWSKTLGTNYIGVFAYYLSSPLSFLTLLSSDVNMPISLLFLTALKIGLCGLTFGIYLMYMNKRTPSIILFSLFYGLMSYNLVYSMCLMWIDGVFWLPIILIGIEELLKRNKMKLLIISLLCVFISTYYISYMVGVFACIYFIYRYVTHYSESMPLKTLGKSLLKFISSAILAAFLGAWFLLPTLASLFDGKIGGFNYIPKNITNFEFKNLISKLFLGSYDSITNSGMPFLYCGLIVTILFIGYFFLKNVSITEKAATFIVTTFLLFSMYLRDLDIAWHIFQRPNWFPYRYSFVLLFFMIFIAYKAFLSIEKMPLSFFFTFPLVSLIISQLLVKVNYYHLKEENIKLTIKFTFFYILCLLLLYFIKNRDIVKPKLIIKYTPILLVTIMFFESCYELYKHSVYLFAGLDRSHHYEDITPYQKYRIAINNLLDEVNQKEKENSFYRLTKDFSRSFNEPISFGYNGIDHYSSAYHRKVNMALKDIGLSADYLWVAGYGSTIVTDSLLNIKYLMSIKPVTDKYERLKTVEQVSLYKKPEDRDTYGEPKDITLYHNPIALSIAFMADSDLLSKPIKASDVFKAQNSLLVALSGDTRNHCFDRLYPESSNINSSITEEDAYIYKKEGNKGIVRYSLVAEKAMELYAYFPFNTNTKGCSVYVNDEYITELYYGQYNSTHFLGSFKKGDEINVELRFRTPFLNTKGNLFYSLDYDKFVSVYEVLKEGNLEVSYYDSRQIKGMVSANEKGILFTSIPYDKGWSVYVNGKKVKTEIYSDTFLCVELPAGEHEITMKYTPRGFTIGLILSIVTFVGIFVFIILRRRHKNKLR